MTKPNRNLRAAALFFSFLLFLLMIFVLMSESRRLKLSKIAPLTSAKIISIRISKNTAYATIDFENEIRGQTKRCQDELWLGGYSNIMKPGDQIEILPNDDSCNGTLWPKAPQLFFPFMLSFMSLIFLMVSSAKYIQAVRMSRGEPHL